MFKEYKTALKEVPSLMVAVFFLAVVAMNLLAGKELFSVEYLALDCGFAVSWITFLLMDVICKAYGPKTAMRISVMSLVFNLLVCGIFYLLSLAPGHWAAYYDVTDPAVAETIDNALNRTIGGSWYVVVGSATAMLISSAVNSALNYAVGKRLKKDNYGSFAARSFISTFLAQIADNLVFAIIVSHVFFGWTWKQVIFCSLTAAAFELLCEVLFSPLGYRLCLRIKA